MTQQIAIDPQEAVMIGATSLVHYGKLFFPKTFRQDSPAFHEEIGRELYNPDNRQIAIEVFRDGAKTTLLRTYLSQRIAYNISRTIMVVSASQGHSILTLRWIKRAVEHNKYWREVFRLRKGAKWSDDHIEIWSGVTETPITVMAVGITGQLRGFNIDDYRPDLILCDDTSTDEASGSAEQRRKEADTFFGALINSLSPKSEAPDAKIVLLDTPKNKFDLIETCQNDPAWKGIRFGIFDGKGQSRWESRYPTEELLKAKEDYTRTGRLSIWLKEKECKITSAEAASFKADNLKFYDVMPDRMTYLIAIDPASSDSKDADDNVVGVLGFHRDDVYLVEYTAEKGQTPEMVAKTVFEYIRRYRPVGIAVESIAYQRVLAWYLEVQMREKRVYIPVYQVQDRRRKSDRIVQAIGETSGYGRLHCKASQTKFIEQYTDYSPLSGNHDDVIDAVAMGITWGETQAIGDWIDGEATEVDDEMAPQLNFRNAP